MDRSIAHSFISAGDFPRQPVPPSVQLVFRGEALDQHLIRTASQPLPAASGLLSRSITTLGDSALHCFTIAHVSRRAGLASAALGQVCVVSCWMIHTSLLSAYQCWDCEQE